MDWDIHFVFPGTFLLACLIFFATALTLFLITEILKINTSVTALSVQFFAIEVASHVSIKFPTSTKCVLDVDNKSNCPNESSSSVEHRLRDS